MKPSKKTKVKEPETPPVEEEQLVVAPVMAPVMAPQEPVVEESAPEVAPQNPVQEAPQPVVETKPAVEEKPQPVVEPQPQPVVEAKPLVSEPVFKVQILISNSRLKSTDRRFKGLTDVGSYQEGGIFKYTVGNSTNYNEIYRLRRSILDKFPEAFIIAFKDNQRVDVNEAIREFKKNKGIK